MKKILFFLTILFFQSFFAQNKEADSLIIVLKKASNTEKAEIINKIADAYKTTDVDKMQQFANQALQISQQQKNTTQEGIALQNLGVSYLILGEYEKALDYLNKAEKFLENTEKSKKNQEALAKNYGTKGIIFSEQNQYANALNYDFKALKIYENLNNKPQLSKIYNNIGVIYRSINDEENALQYFRKAYQIQKENQDAALAVSCSNIGLILLHQNKLDEAKKFFDESFAEFQKNENPRALGELYNNLSRFYLVKSDQENAEKNLLKAEETFLSIEDKFGVSDTYLLLAELYFSQNLLDKSLEFSKKSLALAKELDLPETKMNNEKLHSEIFEKQGNKDLAFLHLKNYEQEKENLAVQENARERIKTELNFQYEKNKIEEKELASREKLKWFFGLIILGILGISGFLYYRNRVSKKNILLQKQLAEFQHKALHLQMNPHFVFNCLAAISAFVMQNDKEEAVKYLAKFSKLMRLTLDFSKESEIPIDKEIEALQNYLELEQLRFKNKFDFKIYKSSEIEDDTVLPTLLLQPYVENSIIHGVVPKAEKGFIEVNFTQTENFLICEIIDNGIGIETSKNLKENSVTAHKSMALEISKKRLEAIEALNKKNVAQNISEIKDENGKSIGTKVVLTLPLQFIKN